MFEFECLTVTVADDFDDDDAVICVDTRKRKTSETVRIILGSDFYVFVL